MIDFSDEELSLIKTIILQTDPTGVWMRMVPPVASILQKIDAYAQAKQQEAQQAQAAPWPTAEDTARLHPA